MIMKKETRDKVLFRAEKKNEEKERMSGRTRSARKTRSPLTQLYSAEIAAIWVLIPLLGPTKLNLSPSHLISTKELQRSL